MMEFEGFGFDDQQQDKRQLKRSRHRSQNFGHDF